VAQREKMQILGYNYREG